jgi:hypothetical protein
VFPCKFTIFARFNKSYAGTFSRRFKLMFSTEQVYHIFEHIFGSIMYLVFNKEQKNLLKYMLYVNSPDTVNRFLNTLLNDGISQIMFTESLANATRKDIGSLFYNEESNAYKIFSFDRFETYIGIYFEK